jgi:sorbitol-specific phosphotransferase system component IIBC
MGRRREPCLLKYQRETVADTYLKESHSPCVGCPRCGVYPVASVLCHFIVGLDQTTPLTVVVVEHHLSCGTSRRHCFDLYTIYNKYYLRHG